MIDLRGRFDAPHAKRDQVGAFDPLFVERQLSAPDSALNYHYNLNHRRILPLYASQLAGVLRPTL